MTKTLPDIHIDFPRFDWTAFRKKFPPLSSIQSHEPVAGKPLFPPKADEGTPPNTRWLEVSGWRPPRKKQVVFHR